MSPHLAAETERWIQLTGSITNLVKAECPAGLSPIEDTSVRRGVLKRHTLDVIVELLKGDGVEDRIKLCFVLGTLMARPRVNAGAGRVRLIPQRHWSAMSLVYSGRQQIADVRLHYWASMSSSKMKSLEMNWVATPLAELEK